MVFQDGVVFVENSPIGIKCNLGDFNSGLVFVAESDVLINETYHLPSGKTTLYTNLAFEKTLYFTKLNMSFTLFFRIYNDGVAFRYSIANLDNSTKTLSFVHGAETSAFTLPSNSVVTHMSTANDIYCSFEGKFQISRVASLSGTHTIPLLYQLPHHSNRWGLISEAHLDGSYCGSVVQAVHGRLTLSFPPRQKGAVVAQTPFTSPWRFVVTGTLAAIIENTMPENLSPAPIGDFSWVEPGVSSWTWLVGTVAIQRNETAIRSYVDLASSMGWKYFLLDEGWQPNAPAKTGRYAGLFRYFPSLVDYAASKGVSFLAWVDSTDFDTPEKRSARLDEWARVGIKGIKVDFFNRESQDRIQLYREIYAKAAERKMLVNCHGANKPTGERRTWPNAISREGVRGEEYLTNSGFLNTILPFTRAAVGPTDFTPRLVPTLYSDTSSAHQLALTVTLECGLPCMADTRAHYEASIARGFLTHLPAWWNETRYVAGAPGKYYIVARRHRDAWYVGGVNGNTARRVTVSLSFLADSTNYTAEIYRDGREGRGVVRIREIFLKGQRKKIKKKDRKRVWDLAYEAVGKVTRTSKVAVAMVPNGGFAMKLVFVE